MDRRRALRLCRDLGFPVDDARDPKDHLMWDGAVAATKRQGASNILHDLAHWLIAPPERRAMPDFGLGHGPESNLAVDVPEVPLRLVYGEEQRASILGIALEFHLGDPDWAATAWDHDWCRDHRLDWWQTAMELEQAGHLRNGRPTCLDRLASRT